MKSVRDCQNEIIIKNSRFITLVYYIDNINDVDYYLNNAHILYKDATHYCYAYIIGSYSKCSDDGEPSGTAGIPIMDVLKKNDLNNVLCIVIRYFGKILLGASGLVRAYSNSVSLCIKDNIIELKNGYNVTVKFNYNNLKIIDYIVRDVKINSKLYQDIVIYDMDIDYDKYNELLGIKDIDIIINRNIYL